MGWTYTHKSSNESAKDFIERNCLTWNSSSHTYRVLDGGVKNFRTYYGAVEKVENSTGNREVFAVVFLLDYAKDYHNFGYKDLDETCGPGRAECPERILKLLTPTTNEYATKWREACWKKINDKKTRVPLAIDTAISYGGKSYVVTGNLGRRGYLITNSNGTLYRLSKANADRATVI